MVMMGVHTSRVAQTISETLERTGIEVETRGIGNGNLVEISVSETDLGRAVQIAEQSLSSAPFKIDLKLAGRSEKLLIPVDFSELSILACKVGFELAARMGLKPVIMHVYTVPYLANTSADTTFPSLDDNENVIENVELEEDEEKVAQQETAKFKKRLDSEIQKGTISNLVYDLALEEGTPEEAILEYTRLTPPAMVVMATRGKEKKDQELVGSVTAEVLDSCRVPVFTVPENYSFENLGKIKKLAFFCNLDDRDVKSMEFFMRMFNYPDVSIMLVPASNKISDSKKKISDLEQYFEEQYPEAAYSIAPFPTKEFRTEFENVLQSSGIEMLMVPNKRSNIFARLFKPGIPHRVLFERDIPMLALPV